MKDIKKEVVEKEVVVKEVKLSKEEQAIKDDKDLILSLQTQIEERSEEENAMLHALLLVEQIERSLSEKQASDKKDAMVIAALKAGLVEAKLELGEAREVFEVAEEKDAKIAAIK